MTQKRIVKNSIENMIGKIVEVESIDGDGYAVIKDTEGYYTDIFPEEYKIVGKIK